MLCDNDDDENDDDDDDDYDDLGLLSDTSAVPSIAAVVGKSRQRC